VIVRGDGFLRTARDEIVPIRSLVAEREKYRPDLPWEVHLRLESDEDAFHKVFTDGYSGDIEGVSDDGNALLIRNFRFHSLHGKSLTGYAFELSQGIEPLDTPPDSLCLTALITDNGVALPLQEPGLKERQPPAVLTGDLGRMQVWTKGTPEKIKIGGRESVAERYATVLEIQVTEESHRAIPLPTLFAQLKSELTDITVLFTLLSRRHVGCSRIDGFANWREPTLRFHKAHLWQEAPDPQRDRVVDPLINPYAIPAGELDAMYQRFRSSPHKDVIRRVALFLAEGFQARQLEIQTLYAFTAFEAIVNALKEHAPSDVMGKAAFRKFRTKLKRGIEECARGSDLTDGQVRDINDKLGELQRRSLHTRSVEVVTALKVKWEDLWPGMDSLEPALKAGYKRRSTFIHAGHLINPEASARDAIRIACLTERIVYALLGGQEAWIPQTANFRWRGMPHDVPSTT
jgi:hypothetical protein